MQIGDDEPSKYYFSRRKAITMRINSFLELIRSFTIAYTKGPEFKEGKLMRLLRVIGLVIPGLAAHSPQDYINTTRLASKEVFLPPKNSSQKNPIIGGWRFCDYFGYWIWTLLSAKENGTNNIHETVQYYKFSLIKCKEMEIILFIF